MDEHLKKIQKDVDNMNVTFEGGEVKTDPPSTDEVKTDPPSTDPPFDGETDEPKTDPPATDEPKTEPPTTDEPDDRDKTIEELRRKLADKDVKTEPPKTAPPATAAPDRDFVGDLGAEDLSPEELNKLLNKTYQQAVEDSRARGIEVTQTLPDLVAAVASLQKATEIFYDENKDLEPFKKIVGTVFEELRLASPDKSYSDIINEVAPETRRRLELPEPSKKKFDKGKPPRLPSKKSKSGKLKDESKSDPLTKELEDMNKSLRR